MDVGVCSLHRISYAPFRHGGGCIRSTQKNSGVCRQSPQRNSAPFCRGVLLFYNPPLGVFSVSFCGLLAVLHVNLNMKSAQFFYSFSFYIFLLLFYIFFLKIQMHHEKRAVFLFVFLIVGPFRSRCSFPDAVMCGLHLVRDAVQLPSTWCLIRWLHNASAGSVGAASVNL